jgi:hypothetical protein
MAGMKEDASPPRPQPSRYNRLRRLRARRLGDLVMMAGYLVLVAVATLTPGTASSRLPLWCVTCTDLWLLDLLQNVALFVPFGWLARRLGAGAGGAVLLGSVISLGVEGAQWGVPSLARDPILGDWLANTAGAALGATLPALWRWWTAPGPAWGRLALSVVWAVGVWWGSWWLVQPAWPTDSDWYGQAAAQLGHLDTLPGRLVRGSVNGIPVPFVLPPHVVLAAGDPPGSLRVEAEVVLEGSSARLAPAVSVFDGRQREVVLLGIAGADLVLRVRARISAIGLRSPMIRMAWPAERVSEALLRESDSPRNEVGAPPNRGGEPRLRNGSTTHASIAPAETREVVAVIAGRHSCLRLGEHSHCGSASAARLVSAQAAWSDRGGQAAAVALMAAWVGVGFALMVPWIALRRRL